MNSNEYREQIRREIEGALGRSQPRIAGTPTPSVPESARQWLQVLGDAAQPAETRRAALQGLQQLSFNVKAFAEVRAEYIAILRRIVDDPDGALREGALETLAQEKDEFAQRRLLAGLHRDEPPLVDDAKAIQFLAYDIHAEHFPVMRRLAQDASDPDTRREAVKALSADTESADLLYRIFDDTREDDGVRQASASALLSVAPARFEQRAKQAVLDTGDAESVRAAALTALAYFASPAAVAGDNQFMEGVSNVESAPTPAGFGPDAGSEGDLAKALRLFRERHGR